MPIDFLNLPGFLKALRSYPWWQVAVEMMLIGLVVFWVVRFLRGTRGARMLQAIAVLLISIHLIVRLLASQFGLERIDFLYGRLLLFTSFAVVVIFQPELRRALMRLGERLPILGTRSPQLDEEIEALVETATFCARRKIGALIAIERDTGLGGIAESGTRINAEISADLLNTIFFPNTPLHDLGVIISHGRVTYAGVQFPLAESGDLKERELGARHRAAVGLSQESDAIVLVVSEETGDVSIAERGQLIRKLTPEGLRDLLSDLLGRSGGDTFRQAA
jgi:diadenylate cyclase